MGKNKKLKMLGKPRQMLSLIEVLAAFFLISISLIPLAYPHARALLEEKKVSLELKAEHDISLLFGKLIQDLYENKIALGDIESKGRKFPISDEKLKEAGVKAPYPTIFIEFSEKHKPKGKSKSVLYFVTAVFEISYENVIFFETLKEAPKKFKRCFTLLKEGFESDEAESQVIGEIGDFEEPDES